MPKFYTKENKLKVYGTIITYLTKVIDNKCFTIYHIHFNLAGGTKIVEVNSRTFSNGQLINDIEIYLE